MKFSLPLLLLAALAATGCVNRQAQAQVEKTKEMIAEKALPVVIQTAVAQDVDDFLEITGSLQAIDDVAVGSTAAGKVVSVYVQEGQAVSAGQVVARVEDQEARQRLAQAESQVQSARAQLQQAVTDAKVGPQRSAGSVRLAESRLKQAEQGLAKARAGARDQERAQAQAQVDAASSQVKTAKAALQRAQNLFKEGAIAKSDLEQAENAYEQANAAYRQALEALSLANNAVRPEDIAIAQSEVNSAREALRIERANLGLDANYAQRTSQAQSALRSAQEGVNMARKMLADTVIRAPFGGRVAGRPIQPGVVVGPGTPVVRLVSDTGLTFNAEVPEGQVPQIKVGREVEVKVDAIPGTVLNGIVESLDPGASGVARLYTVRVRIAQRLPSLKPGMFARGKLTIGQLQNIIFLPEGAVSREGDSGTVYMVRDEKAERVQVKIIGARGGRLLTTGLKSGDQVVVQGQTSLYVGAPVRVEKAKP